MWSKVAEIHGWSGFTDQISSEEVARRCGVKPVLTVVRESRLRWFGQVWRRGGDGVKGARCATERKTQEAVEG